ncbi:MAG: peptidylprolyl isomerase [Candidatus Aegiribacteria sp.]
MSSSNGRSLVWAVWTLAAVAAAATTVVVLGVTRRVEDPVDATGAYDDGVQTDSPVAASVGGSMIYHEDLPVIGIDDPSLLEVWVEDELLAGMARESGLENPRRSRLLQDRVRQIYLRDELLSRTYSGISFPDSAEVFRYMQSDSPAYMVERHYHQILVSTRQMADSVHGRLSLGENFQITAENLSIGQKAGTGGDLGFMTAGELMAYGIPRDAALPDGLGDPVESPYGWHIIMVTEERPLEDTARVVRAVADDIYRNRMTASRDSLLEVARMERETYIDTLLLSRGRPAGSGADSDGGGDR